MNYELLATDNWQLATKYERRATSDGRRATSDELLCKTKPISETLK